MSDSIDVAVGVVEGKVVIKWHEPVTEITFDANNAYTVGEAMARAAHEAHFGAKANVGADRSFIAEQIKMRVTDELRQKMILKAATIVRSMQDQKRTPGQIAVHVVDSVLQETAR